MKPAFNVKSARLDALAVQLNSSDPEAVRETLQNNIEKYIKFKSLPFILDISQIEDFTQVPLGDMVMLFAFHEINIVALRHGNPDAAAFASQYRLGFSPLPKAEDGQADGTQPENEDDGILRNDNDAVKTVEMAKSAEWVEAGQSDGVAEENTEAVLPEEETAADNGRVDFMAAKPTIVVSQPVRTGQQIYAEQADLIVLGSVSPGAEVIADGNIHIYAALRGKALAGASGDEKARIFVHSMQAELVSIAGIYRVFEQKLPPHLHEKPVKIELQNERLAISAIHAE